MAHRNSCIVYCMTSDRYNDYPNLDKRVTHKFIVELKFLDENDVVLFETMLSWRDAEKFLLEKFGGYGNCDIIVERLMSDGIFKFGRFIKFEDFLKDNFDGYTDVSECLHSLVHAGVAPAEKRFVANCCKKLNIKSFFTSPFFLSM